MQLKGGTSFTIWDRVSIGCEGLASAVLRFTSVLSSRFCPLVLGAPRAGFEPFQDAWVLARPISTGCVWDRCVQN